MFEHLTKTQVEDFGSQQLSPGELLSVSDHLASCEACREQVERAFQNDAAFFAIRSEVLATPVETISSPVEANHPTVEQITEYVDGITTGDELQAFNDHLTICKHCDLAVNDLRAFKSQVAPTLEREYRPAFGGAAPEIWRRRLLTLLPGPFARTPLAFSSALAVLLLIVIGWLVWQAQQGRETKPEIVIVTPTPSTSPEVATPSPAPTLEAPAAPLVAELNDAGGRITLDRDGKLVGTANLPPAYQRMVKDSLTNQQLAKSSLLVGLNRPGSLLMGSDEQGNKFSVIEPIGKVVLSDRPPFRWSKLEGATGYVIEVYDERFNLVATSRQVSSNSWTVPHVLKRGEVYSWQVKAIKDEQEIKSPHPPAPQAKFRILDQRRANDLAQAQRAYGSSHLMMGLLYAEAGLLDQAEKEFRGLQKANPDSPIARRLLSQIQKLRR